MVILSVIAAYFVLLLLVAWLTGKRGSHDVDFFTGSRRSPWYVVSVGMIGSSLSGVSFVSVPGWVGQTDMTYMQMVAGFFFGYVLIAKILLPLYYRLKLVSVYTYLEGRIGRSGYKTGASFFILSKMTGAAARFYLAVLILQTYVFDRWGIPFGATAALGVFLMWLYTCRSGVKTVVWTDTLQTVCFVGMTVAIIWQTADWLGLDMGGTVQAITESPHFRIFEFGDWNSSQHFVKQFLSGVFITVAMTGLDQDMMQKNLSCRNLKEARRNMYAYGLAFTPVNFMLLCLGILLTVAARQMHVELPASGDDILPAFCTSGLPGSPVLILFSVGIIAAAFSSADSALTALTASFCIDILDTGRKEAARARRTRMKVHLLMSAAFLLTVTAFRAINSQSVIDAVYRMASYTYGPLLGLFAFGLFTKRMPEDRFVLPVCILAPAACLMTEYIVSSSGSYRFGYEILMLNGAFTFAGLLICSSKPPAGSNI
ncbi:MAG: sodium:solute symporter [Tannerella sp.]|nr:sodium:solute symporter [Tannerella sp.]